MATELASLVDAEMIRVLDLLVLEKAADGSIEGFEVEDLGDLGELRVLEGQLAEVLAPQDVERVGAAMEPASTAGVLVTGPGRGRPGPRRWGNHAPASDTVEA